MLRSSTFWGLFQYLLGCLDTHKWIESRKIKTITGDEGKGLPKLGGQNWLKAGTSCMNYPFLGRAGPGLKLKIVFERGRRSAGTNLSNDSGAFALGTRFHLKRNHFTAADKATRLGSNEAQSDKLERKAR